jgi:hypothetical protein
MSKGVVLVHLEADHAVGPAKSKQHCGELCLSRKVKREVIESRVFGTISTKRSFAAELCERRKKVKGGRVGTVLVKTKVEGAL